MMKLMGMLAALALSATLIGCGADAAAYLPESDAYLETVRSSIDAPLAEAAYRRFSPYSGSDTLRARDDYGALLPYIGATTPDSGSRWGLVTEDGAVVTDPVYGEILPYGPFYLLFRGGVLDSRGVPMDDAEVTVCARDGRWVRDAGDWNHSLLLDEKTLVAARDDGSILVLSPEGTVISKFTREQLTPYLGEGYDWLGPYGEGGEVVYAGGPIAVCFYDEDSPYGNFWDYKCFMDPYTGEILGDAPEGWTPENGWGDLEESPEFPDYRYPDRLTDLVTGETYYCGHRQGDPGQGEDLLDESGYLLLLDCFTPSSVQWEPVIADGMLGTVVNGSFRYTTIGSGVTVFQYPLEQAAY